MPVVRGQIKDEIKDEMVWSKHDQQYVFRQAWFTTHEEEAATDEEAEAIADKMERSGLYDRVVVESNQYIEPSEFDKKGVEMKYHNTMDKKRRGVGSKTKVRPETVVMKDSKTGKVFGRRTLVQKSTESTEMKFLTALLDMLNEAEADITTLPDQVVSELRKLVRKGAQDLEQDWENALELVNKAYQVSNVRLPAPDQKGAWKQYEQLIKDGVMELKKTRGLDGKWRTTDTVIREAAEKDPLDMPIGKRRFFVDIPGLGSAEVAAKTMDDIIEQITNKLRRHGAKTRIDERDKKHAILSVWVNNVQRERVVVKEVS